MSDRHSFLSDNFYVGSDNVRYPTVILSTEDVRYHWQKTFVVVTEQEIINSFIDIIRQANQYVNTENVNQIDIVLKMLWIGFPYRLNNTCTIFLLIQRVLNLLQNHLKDTKIKLWFQLNVL